MATWPWSAEVLTDRIVQITHANWSPIEGSRGKVEKDVTLVDVSPEGNWSQVKVWYDPSRDLGGSTYPTYGFIYQDAKAKIIAATGLGGAENTAIAMAQSAANHDGLGRAARRRSAADAEPGGRLHRPHRGPDRQGHRRRQPHATEPASDRQRIDAPRAALH